MIWGFYVRSVPFTKGVIAGTESLGGSESACLGLARALATRGHNVYIFAHGLAPDARGADQAGVVWLDARDLRTTYRHWTFDCFVSLRMVEAFVDPPQARWRVLWNEDLLVDTPPGTTASMVANSWAVDTTAYVSAYHRHQWEGVEAAFTPLGWVTKNGFDPSLVPTDVQKDWRTVIHISRPERGLSPLLRMWPELRRRVPEAQLQLCRYNSMYDKDGWAKVCAAFDAEVQAVNRAVGGITYLGELAKPALYQAIASAAVMWYPGVSTFAETSCIAAIEAQACGTPLVASNRGALPETAPHAVLVDGVAEDPTDDGYAAVSIENVALLMEACRDGMLSYEWRRQHGKRHVVPAYTFDAIAAEWEAKAVSFFLNRWETKGWPIVRTLLHYDDHVAARQALTELEDRVGEEGIQAAARCEKIIAGLGQQEADFAAFAEADPVREGDVYTRFPLVAEMFAGCTHVLDVACGNGAAALKLARTHPTMKVTALDYSPDLIARAQAWAVQLGVADRVTFQQMAVYDYHAHDLTETAQTWIAAHQGEFDGLFCGEFLEHCANAAALIDGLELALQPDALCIYTMPHGPFMELWPAGRPEQRTHVHHWEVDDLREVFGLKGALSIRALDFGLTPSGVEYGNWIVGYRVNLAPAGDRNLSHRIKTTRPRPSLSVGILANDDALDLRRCLASVAPVADEIVIGDSSVRTTLVADLAAEYGARVIRIPAPTDLGANPDGFAGARNRVLHACTGEWFLWIDTDETLEGAVNLRRYLEAGPFNGYAIHQIHLMTDSPAHSDTPVRVFRRLPSIQFYGCVHEQPQMGDCNGDIIPALELADVTIAHIGYRTEGLRRQKAGRNRPLLRANDLRFPTRRLNGVLTVRELVLQGNDAVAMGQLAEAEALYGQAITLFEAGYLDPADKTAQLGRPFYEQALKYLNGAWEFEYSFAGSPAHIAAGVKARPKRVRVRSFEDIKALLLHEIDQAGKKMVGVPPDTTPYAPAREAVSA